MTDFRPDARGAVGFLHTSHVHVATFDALSHEHMPAVHTLHRVDPKALEVARQDGTGDRVRAAVALGPRIGVVAALTSTVEPTTRVLTEEAADARSAISVEVNVADGAWDAFLAGNAEAYRFRIARAARALSTRCDVVVLAQASMESAAALLTGLATPVLTSPRSAVEAVAKAVPSR
ncbi:hypothetical protein [Arthrobacter sp. UYEF3]|uniref:hypothetical protein n=1 Tax=Arthrobacter sp. UYEF3 TaxID=1756365 RepID=UPI003392C74D